MTRKRAQLEVNNFTRGLITEASPLTFPEGASIDEQNFELNIDGSRDRRLGMDYEDDAVVQSCGTSLPSSGNMAFQVFNWENAGGIAENQLIAVQIGNYVQFFLNNESNVSDNILTIVVSASFETELEISGITPSDNVSFANIDGQLIMACGLSDVYVFTYNDSLQRVTYETNRLKIRDIFGVEDSYTLGLDTVDLLDDEYAAVQVSSADITEAHLYNLNNQSWGHKVFPADTGRSISPLGTYDGNTDYPSNAQTVWVGVQFNTDTPPQQKFYHLISQNDDLITFPAAKGYFIIDALERGTSREEAYARNISVLNLPTGAGTYDHPTIGTGNLPVDRTEGGAKVVSEFAGRIFYAGFSSELTDGDARSPRMSSYILFSQLVKDPKQLFRCYQSGDPTSQTSADLVDTDGGLIKIEGAYNISRMVNIGESLIVLAENGVWAIRGESGVGFKATSYEVVKISTHGCTSPYSAVEVDNSLVYWGDDAIYQIAKNEIGDLASQNLSNNTIQSFYESIEDSSKRSAVGIFDSYSRRVRWVYDNDLPSSTQSSELVLDVGLGAFYPSKIQGASTLPKIVAPFTTPPFLYDDGTEFVYVGSDQVEASADPVIVLNKIRQNDLREIKYLTITSTGGGLGPVNYTFSHYKDSTFVDWKTYDDTGVDAAAYFITGYTTGGDSMRYKQVPVIVSHFRRTESGFTLDEEDDLVPINQSSCILQSQWEWSNSANSNRWGRDIQLYQYKRHYIPADALDDYDNGFETIVTRRKLRGKGRAISLKFSTEPLKDCRLLGWGMDMSVQGRA